MEKIIFGLVGPIASGKEVTKKYLIDKYNAKDCKFSSSLRDVLNRIGVPTSRENMQRLSTILRENFGEDLLSKIIATDSRDLDAPFVVIDGVRRPTDIKDLRELPNFFLVKIDAYPELRYERMKARNENPGDENKSYENFIKDHESEADSLVPIIMKESSYSIENNGSIDDLYKQIDEIIEKIKHQ
jgi:dephospho-CoA kinase